ncbi:MAG: hypothetical protein QOG10_5814 [Kribbellaceae bacterium]|nr:hypothetical protein [Kribbellaceae bacterium]
MRDMAAHGHLPTVYIREDQLAAKVDEWVARLFSPEDLDETVAIGSELRLPNRR